ncbi:MAG: sigma-70 family RNA polymerase sigma factor, partial [Deltaproteobacteria bacterium]|nr:sigma-70 family RNA polymerase sigma factor [Kofleriaceae bacterium]
MNMDVGAFTELVRTHQAAVAAVAYAIVRDRAIAHDLTQEAFVKAWRNQDELREPEKAGAWLCGIVRFLARDHRRVERRRAS